ncbi:hypothetical protein E4P40_03690 [Blastococcus sp. CT_GayMR20]|uniref:hypothetical protein n=1 Tax=Blastococcus sp. CT_GayMR20 TaxID=2559609 RepID=UPI001073168B|nr:hypothetical protein [Blastococcus sp. CT_GayMR20]TFV92050.1 hypothetical protein E4P40_03690 [Blastococcus sp. CT_GayMR20]
MITATELSLSDPAEGSGNETAGPRRAGFRQGWTSQRVVLLCAGVLVLVQVASRAWVLDDRWLFGDDLSLASQSMAMSLFSSEFLFEGRGGHLVPGALVLSGALIRLDPMEWWPLLAASVVLSALASLAVWRLIRVFMGDRPAMLVPLAAYLFSALNLGGFTWWSATMQTVPLQAGVAWVVADSVLYLRTGRTRYAVTAPLGLAVTLLFSERAVTIPLLALAVLALLLHVEGVATPLREVWRRTRALWLGILLVLAGWTAAFLAAVPNEEYSAVTVAQLVDTVRHFGSNLVPGLVGGPWAWTEQPGGTPMAAVPPGLFTVSVVALLALVVWTSCRRRGAPVLWLIATGYVTINVVLVGLGRSAFGFAEFLPLSYRYYPAEPVLLAIVVALLFALPARAPAPAAGRIRALLQEAAAEAGARVRSSMPGRWVGRLLVPALTVVYLAGATISTVGHVEAWEVDPARDYFTTARSELAAAGDSPLLDQAVPQDIMWGLGVPYNTTAVLFRPYTDRPQFGQVTDRLQVFDEAGNLRPAAVTPLRTVEPGPLTGCGWGVQSGETTAVGLSGPLIPLPWTVQLNYLAGRDGVMTVALDSGDPVRVPVEKGLHTVFLRLSGGGGQLTVRSDTVGLGVCIDSGVVGDVAPSS